MLSTLRSRAQDEKGFTLIELLVVILIIGILAAIAIPSFIGQRAKANDASAKSAVKTAQTAMETFFTDNQTYVGGGATQLQQIEPTLTDLGTRLTVGGQNRDTFWVQVTSDRTGDPTFRITRAADGSSTRTCTAPSDKKGGCTGANNTW